MSGGGGKGSIVSAVAVGHGQQLQSPLPLPRFMVREGFGFASLDRSGPTPRKEAYMAITTIRPFTDTDKARLNAACSRFVRRHGLRVFVLSDSLDWTDLDCALASESPELRRAWHRAFCRALGHRPRASLTVAYGYVGDRT